ncbi:transcriptional regulator, AraC family [Aquipluma nitroreducens]|uniref:Transcriptional regulator, AraC family n=1 Tax=Aquipluma nitroreducens TaxID=2010828 RepID=A0A5K7SA13_9BACT|nr:helix-turn-helix domain-containing protein [Aquipluma nitroreducens]BBE18124.1 transcriptional regulator, AraC family [Aquipluma nitroreducens]
MKKNVRLFDEESEKIFTIRKICDFNDEEIEHNLIPHLHDFYSIFWIESGEAIHATEFVEYSLKADTILFVPPGLKHRMYIDKSVGGTYILFNEEFIQYNRTNHVPLKEYRLFNNSDFKSLITVVPEKREKLNNITGLIFEELKNSDDYSQDIVLNLLHLFLLESRRIFDQQNQVPKEESETTPDTTIIKFKQLIEENFAKEKNVSLYAEMLNMNPSCLNELTKRTTGITAGELIRNRVIDETKKLLYSSSMSGKEIAYELGFDDPAYFSRFFKKYTGTTLKEFRDVSRKKYH